MNESLQKTWRKCEGLRIEGEARVKAGGRGLGRGLGEPLPRKFFEKSNSKPFNLVHS